MTQPNQPTPFRASDWFYVAFLLVIAATNLLIAIFVIPKFEQIYHDMLGTRALPPATSFVMQWRYLLAMLAFAYAAIAIIIPRRATRRLAHLSRVALLIVALIHTGFATISLFSPLLGDIETLRVEK